MNTFALICVFFCVADVLCLVAGICALGRTTRNKFRFELDMVRERRRIARATIAAVAALFSLAVLSGVLSGINP